VSVTLVARVTYLATARMHDNFDDPCVTLSDLVSHQRRKCSPMRSFQRVLDDHSIHKHRGSLEKKCAACGVDVPFQKIDGAQAHGI